jgi:serine/threonine protein kinase
MSEEGQTSQPGRVSLEDFTLIKVIGKGTYGKVMLVRHKKVRYL